MQGRLRKQPRKHSLRKSILLLSSSGKHLSSLLIDSGSRCCSLRVSTSRLKMELSQRLIFYRKSCPGSHRKGRRKQREHRLKPGREGTASADQLLLLQWALALLAQASSLVGLWGGCYFPSDLILAGGLPSQFQSQALIKAQTIPLI